MQNSIVTPTKPPMIFAHRGFRAQHPENTLQAFEKAMETGCDGIELDVQLSKDGQVVVCHDETLERCTNGSGPVCRHTLAQLKGLNAGGGQSIPTLEEYFALTKNSDIITNIELKDSIEPYPEMLEKVLALLDACQLRQRVILSSFNKATVLRARKAAPDIKAAYICGQLGHIGRMAAMVAAHGLCYIHPHLAGLGNDEIKAAAAAGVQLNVWTVNEESDMRRLFAAGVHGVFTDRPDVAMAVRGQM